MASAANGVTVATDGINHSTIAFSAGSDGGACNKFFVSNRTGSSGNVLVNISGLHSPGQWAGIAPGQSMLFGAGGLKNNGITQVQIETDASTATVDYGVVERV